MMRYLSAYERFRFAAAAHTKAPPMQVFNGYNDPILPTDAELDEFLPDDPLPKVHAELAA